MMNPVSRERDRFAVDLAGHLHPCEWTAARLLDQLNRLMDVRPRWGPALVERLLKSFPSKPTPGLLAAFLETDRNLTRIRKKSQLTLADRMLPSAVPGSDRIRPIDSVGALGDWLGLSPNDLLWYADVRGLNVHTRIEEQRHYGIVWVPKRSGGSRLLEIPKPRLKQIQRKILRQILDYIPPHEAAHGFRAAHSTVTYAEPHCGRAIVLRFDLQDFFPSVASGRVYGIFRSLGYPADVARLLTGLCTTRLSTRDWMRRPHPAPDGSDHAIWQRLSGPHLPQGAPTSPALANLAAYGLDVRLSAYARSQDWKYRRYADDLAVSGGSELRQKTKTLQSAVATIVAESGFRMNAGKQRVMTQGRRQELAGVVVNLRPNLRRADYDRLKAIVTNCLRHGPDSQNRGNSPHFRNVLRGQIAALSAIHPPRGRKMAALFDRIVWELPPSDLQPNHGDRNPKED